MKSPWYFLVAVFFLGLISLEIGHGLFRLRTLRTAERRELLELVDREHRGLARQLRDLVGEGERHAEFLSRLPALSRVLEDAGDPAAREAATDLLLRYLASFQGIDRVCLLDSTGRERLRCERMGGAVGALPPELLSAPGPDPFRSLVEGRAPGEVVVSRLFVDAERVEVSEVDRRVFHYVTALAEPPGTLVVTVYAAPLSRAVAAFSPLAGVSSALVDDRGEPFADLHLDPGDPATATSLLARHPQASLDLVAGIDTLDVGEALFLAEPVSDEPFLALVTAIPATSSLAASSWREERVRVIGTVLLVTLTIAAASIFFVRQGVRSMRLRETERHLAHIERERQRYRALMEGAADLIFIVDPASGAVRECNGLARETLGERGLWSALTPAAEEELRAALSAAALGGGQPASVRDLALKDRSGRRLRMDARLTAIELDEEGVVEIALRDLTTQREMERQVQTSERLRSLGLLTAGVAHEINNPLEGIANYLSLLRRDGLPEERRRGYVERVEHGFHRIRDIVGDLLRFARPRAGDGRADLGAVVRRAEKVARYSKLLRDVEIHLDVPQGPLLVTGDPGRLEQVLLNLLLNAGRATRGPGEIRVTVEEQGGEVVLRVADRGCGIPEEDLDRLFDPFFTRTEGTGLGLSVSYGIIRAHGGTIRARNRTGGGAEFEIRIPASGPAAEEPA